MFAFLNSHATKKPVAALDAATVPLGWTEITTAKEYRRLLGSSDDASGRESGWLVAFHRDGEPDLKAGHGRPDVDEDDGGGDDDDSEEAESESHDWNAEIVPSISKIGVLRAASVDCSSSNSAASTPVSEGGLKEHCDEAFAAERQAVGKKKRKKKKKKKGAVTATLVVRSFPHPGSGSSSAAPSRGTPAPTSAKTLPCSRWSTPCRTS